MLPKKSRVPLQSFPRNAKIVARTKNFTLKLAANSQAYNRCGVIISKAGGKSTERNRLRRFIMDFFGSNKDFARKTIHGRDFVVLVNTKLENIKLEDIKRELTSNGKLF